MNIIASNKIENCLSGESVFNYQVDANWSVETIVLLEELGRLRYYNSYPTPMFHVSCSDGTFIKGIEGASEFKVIFDKNNHGKAKERFEKLFRKVFSKK